MKNEVWTHLRPVTKKNNTSRNMWISDVGLTFPSRKQNMCITFIQHPPSIFDVGPTLYKCYTNVLRLLGWNWTCCDCHVILFLFMYFFHFVLIDK